MSVVKKVVQIVVIVVLIAFAGILAVSCVNTEPEENTSNVELVKLADIDIPEHLDTDKLFGLFFYDENGVATPTKNGVENICYDKNKPTIIFIHGMQMNYGYNRYDTIPNAAGIVKAGYNFGVFLWSQHADCNLPGIGKTKIWGRTNGSFYYEDENGKRVEETEDVLKYATAEVFTAYYLDFFEQVGFDCPSITLSGHSLGANTLFAVTSYLTTLYDEGLIKKECLPDRCTFLDAYLDASVDDDTYVPWLGHTIGEEGVVGMAKVAVDRARELGISTEYVKSCELISYLSDLSIYGGTTGTSKSLFDKMLYLDFNTDFTEFAGQHTACLFYMLNTAGTFVAYDSKAEDESEFAFNFNTPISYSYARNGVIYEMASNKDGNRFDDDVYYSTNVTNAKIAGFAFNDKNNNGINDDRVYNRVAGVKVSLWCDGQLVSETTTAESGYYEFALSSSDVGKKFVVKAELSEGTFAKESDGGYMNNGVNSNGTSAELSITSDITLKIVNIGING